MPKTTHYSPEERRKRIFAIVGASSGNLVEWFDFYIYAFTALYFAHAFFPSQDPTVQLLNTAGVFAAGFLVRPLGGWLFGTLADRRGRRTSMMISVIMMCLGSLAIACMPTYEQIGTLAPVLLLAARLLQGLSVGGEYGTSATYMSEVALKGERGFFASFQYVTLIGGQLLAVLVIVILQQLLTTEEMRTYGWRIPFVVGAATAVIAFFLRRSLHETQSQDNLKRKESGSLTALFSGHTRAFMVVLGFTAGGSLMFYTFTTYMQKYLVNTAHMEAKTASLVMTAALFVYMCMQPLFGKLSDHIGRRHMMIGFGLFGALLTWPILWTLQSVTNPVVAFLLIIVAMAAVSLYTSISGLIKAELFPAEVRALGVGLSYAVANALFGGSAEYVALGLKTMGHEGVFYTYVTIMCLLAMVVSITLPRKASYLHEDL